MRYFAVLAGALAIVGQAGLAHGEPADPDGRFLAELAAAGITYNSADQAITSAKLVCEYITDGKASAKVLDGLKARNPGLTTERGSQFVGIAAQSYCPDQLVHDPQ